MRRLMAEIVPVPRVAGDALTITELARRYVERMRHDGRKHSSIVAVESVVATWLEPYFAERDLRQVRVEDVRELARMMEKGTRPGPRRKGDRRFGRPLATKTVRDRIATLSAMLALAERQGWIAGNVAKRVDLPRGAPQVSEIRFLEAVEVEALTSAAVAGDHQALDRALYVTAAMTGLRQGELIALRWPDVDWGAQRIRVRRSRVLAAFETRKSRRSTRSVPMSQRVAASSTAARRSLRADEDLVFAEPAGGAVLRRGALMRRYRRRPESAQRDERTASTTCATRSEPRWLPPGCRCAPCRSGWATGTSDDAAVRRLCAEPAARTRDG